MSHRFHVEDRRGAAEQELRRAQHRRPINRSLGMRRFEWPNALGEPCLEGEILRQAPEQRLRKMDVGLHLPGKNDQPLTVEDAGLFRPNLPTFQRSNALDSAFFYENVGFQNAPRRIHCDHPTAAKQQRHQEIRGPVAVESAPGGKSKYASSSSFSSSSLYTPARMRSAVPGSTRT